MTHDAVEIGTDINWLEDWSGALLYLRDSIQNDLRRSDQGLPLKDLRVADERPQFLVTNETHGFIDDGSTIERKRKAFNLYYTYV